MDLWEEIERFKNLILKMELPKNDYAFFGVRCPYCGKSDRVNPLESPEELEDCPEEYRRRWIQFSTRGDPVICKFCRQVLSYDKETKQVSPLTEL
jgi:hypothetical protein